MTVNMSFLQEDGPEEMKVTLVHEMAHILTLNDSQVNEKAGSCSTYKLDEGCANITSYIVSFFNQFWKSYGPVDEYDEDAAYDRYDKNPTDFVNDYAATNPVEDLAETFAHFVLEDKPKNCDATVADKEKCSLYEFSELVTMRDNIRVNLVD